MAIIRGLFSFNCISGQLFWIHVSTQKIHFKFTTIGEYPRLAEKKMHFFENSSILGVVYIQALKSHTLAMRDLVYFTCTKFILSRNSRYSSVNQLLMSSFVIHPYQTCLYLKLLFLLTYPPLKAIVLQKSYRNCNLVFLI